MKLLITARDPATAVSIEKLIPFLDADPRFELRILCQAPACEIFASFNRLSLFEVVAADEALLQYHFTEFKPDAVLTGISGPDIGVDEAVLHYAKQHEIPSYALQSFWGDMNQASGATPDVAFVLDDEAVRVTQRRYPDVESVSIGSIKHLDYQFFNPMAARNTFRPSLVHADEVLLGFYGQPILDIPGYFKTLEALARQLKNWQKPFKLLYRPHPKESEKLKTKTWNLFTEQIGASRVMMDELRDIKDSLVVCDLVLSAFSTCGFDNLYLNELAPEPFSASVYLWFDEDLISWWQAYSHLDQMPLIAEELLLSVDKEEEMLDVLVQGLQPETQHQLWLKAKQHLPPPAKAVDIMIETLLNQHKNNNL